MGRGPAFGCGVAVSRIPKGDQSVYCIGIISRSLNMYL